MKYLNNYETETKRDVDLNRPMVSVVDSDISTLTYDDTLNLNLICSGSITIASRTSAPSDSGYLYKYTTSEGYNNTIFKISTTYNGHICVLYLDNDSSSPYAGKFTYSYGQGGNYTYIFNSPNFYEYLYLKESTRQGWQTITYYIYSNTLYQTNTVLNYEIYDKV